MTGIHVGTDRDFPSFPPILFVAAGAGVSQQSDVGYGDLLSEEAYRTYDESKF